MQMHSDVNAQIRWWLLSRVRGFFFSLRTCSKGRCFKRRCVKCLFDLQRPRWTYLDKSVCYAIENEKHYASFSLFMPQRDHCILNMKMQEMWWHIWCCDPVAMATTVQRQIIPVLISINSRTEVIYVGPLSSKSCISVMCYSFNGCKV